MSRPRSFDMTRRIAMGIASGLFVVTFASALIAAQDARRTTWDGIYTTAQADRGKEQYRRSCSGCHGPTLEGDGMASPLEGEGFLTSWSGRSVYDLVARIDATMPADNAGSLPHATVV